MPSPTANDPSQLQNGNNLASFILSFDVKPLQTTNFKPGTCQDPGGIPPAVVVSCGLIYPCCSPAYLHFHEIWCVSDQLKAPATRMDPCMICLITASWATRLLLPGLWKRRRKVPSWTISASNLLRPKQHRFLDFCSYYNYQIGFSNLLTNLGKRALAFAIPYHDMSGDFDRVSPSHLIFKFTSFGIPDPIWSWLSSCQTRRSQVVSSDGVASHPRPFASGVIQGSLIGLLPFLMYIYVYISRCPFAVCWWHKNGSPS